MTYGFQFFANTGNVSIDNTSFNYALISTNNLTSSFYKSGYYGNIYLASITYSGINPVIAVYSPNALASVAWIDNNGNGSFTAHIFTGFSSQSVTAYVFDRVPNASAGNSGIELFDTSGALIFDSNRKYMNVRGMIYGGNVTNLPNSKYAFIPASVGVAFSSDALGCRCSVYGYQSISTGLNVGQIVWDLTNGIYLYLGTNPAGVIIDVTNL